MCKFPTNTPQLYIIIANNEVIKSRGVGNIPVVLKGSGTVSEITNVLYVPDAAVNILSVSSDVKKGYCMFISKDGCKTFDQEGCEVKEVKCLQQGKLGEFMNWKLILLSIFSLQFYCY
jgi:hypothetical protein